MNKSEKLNALQSFLQGNTKPLKELRDRPRRPIDYNQLSDAQLAAIIEAGTGKPCPDYDSMTDEELDDIINGKTSSFSMTIDEVYSILDRFAKSKE